MQKDPKKSLRKKRILILTCERGGKGHIVPARSVASAINKKAKEKVIVDIVDIYDYLSMSGSKAFNDTYVFFSKYVPFVVKTGFVISNSKFMMRIITYSHYLNYGKKLRKLFEQKKPDLILNNFPHWQYLSWLIWHKNYPKKPFISLVTDSQSVHHGWTMGKIDKYIVADNTTKKALVKRHKKSKDILVFGIPVKLAFMQKINKSKVLKSYDLDPKKFTILFLTSSLKDIKSIRLLKENLTDKNIILVAGRNKKVLPELKKIKAKNIAVIGWTDQMPKLLKASDIVITKAGGSTIAECLAAKKPVIIYKIVPGQEEGNAQFIINNRLGVLQQNYRLLIDSIAKMQKNYNQYLSRLNKYSHPDSATKTANYLLDLLSK